MDRLLRTEAWHRGRAIHGSENERRAENSRILAAEHLAKLQNVAARRFAYGDPSLLDFYLQWRLASAIVGSFNHLQERSLQMDIIHEYIKAFSMLLKIPLYTSSLNVPALQELVLRTYHISKEWLKAFIIVINSVNPQLAKQLLFYLNQSGDSLLHAYVRNGVFDRELLDFLIHVCGPNVVNFLGETPLKLAMYREEASKKQFTEQLLEHGADINHALKEQFKADSQEADSNSIQQKT